MCIHLLFGPYSTDFVGRNLILVFFSQPPTLPAPLLLHLGVTAQTHAIPDYTCLFGDLDHFHIDWQALVQGTLPPGTEESGPCTQLRVRREEKEVAESVLNQMIRYKVCIHKTCKLQVVMCFFSIHWQHS